MIQMRQYTLELYKVISSLNRIHRIQLDQK